MTTKVIAQGQLFLHQLGTDIPEGHLDQGRRLVGHRFAKQAVLHCPLLTHLSPFHGQAHTRQHRSATAMQAIKGASPNQGLDRAAIDQAFVHPPAEIEQAQKGATLGTLPHQMIDRVLARALDRAQTVTHLAP